MNKKELERLAANLQFCIRKARERGEDTRELEEDLNVIVDKLLVMYPVTVVGAVGCDEKERM